MANGSGGPLVLFQPDGFGLQTERVTYAQSQIHPVGNDTYVRLQPEVLSLITSLIFMHKKVEDDTSFH